MRRETQEFEYAETLPVVAGAATQPDDDDADLDRILGELKGGGDAPPVRLYRIVPGTRKETFLGNIPLDVQSALDYVKDVYGGGDYRVKCYSGGRLKVNEAISIDGAIVPQATAQASAPQASGIAEILAAMQEQNRQFQAAMLSTLSELRRPQEGGGIREMLETMSLMKSVLTPAQSGLGATEMFTAFQSGIEMARSVTPSDREASATDVLLEGVKHLLPAIVQGATTGQQQTSPVAALLAPQQTAQPPQPQHSQGDDMSIQLKLALNFLTEQASRKADVTLYADLVLDQMGDDVARNFLSAPDWFEQIKAHAPKAEPYRAWFEALRTEILAILTGPVESGKTGAPNLATGDNATLSGDASRH